VPSTIVISPDRRITIGNGRLVSKSSFAATHAPSDSTAIWPSETSPTRPIRMPSPRATIE
jgi:hypothetical protein